MIFGFSKTDKKEQHCETQGRYEAAFEKIEGLGGSGIWDAEVVVIDLSNTEIENKDLSVFKDFEIVQSLILDNTKIDDDGLSYLESLHHLELLSLIGTQVSEKGLNKLALSLPDLDIVTEPLPKDTINPFTGKTFDSEQRNKQKHNQAQKEDADKNSAF